MIKLRREAEGRRPILHQNKGQKRSGAEAAESRSADTTPLERQAHC